MQKIINARKFNLMRRPFLRVVLMTFVFGSTLLSASEDERGVDVYLTKKEAFALAFPGADQIKKEKKWLTDTQREAIGKILGEEYKKRRLTYYFGLNDGGRPSSAMIIGNEIGRSYPITFMVVINPDGTVKDVEIMVYREPHGWEVRFESFLSQFFGRDAGSPFDDINNITGATLSVRSMTRGIKKAVAEFQVIYKDKVK
jgi:Na+-translocating ferredoxin:NAD+ oxidoreductase RnfG subunit